MKKILWSINVLLTISIILIFNGKNEQLGIVSEQLQKYKQYKNDNRMYLKSML